MNTFYIIIGKVVLLTLAFFLTLAATLYFNFKYIPDKHANEMFAAMLISYGAGTVFSLITVLLFTRDDYEYTTDTDQTESGVRPEVLEEVTV